MAKTIFIKTIGDSEYQWLADGAVLGGGSLEQLQGDIPAGARLWLLLPGDKVLLSQLPCTAKERRHLRKAAPYELEEQLISDVEQLHFAFTSPADNMVTTAVCDKDWLTGQLAVFQQSGLELHNVVPEPLLLPLVDAGWTLRRDEQCIHVRCGESQGFSIDLPLAAVALQQLLSEQGEPQQILLLGDNDDEIGELQDLLPQVLHPYCESRLEPWPQSLFTAADKDPAVNMRQGSFSNHLPVMRWWQQWQKVAILAAVVVVIFAAAQIVQYNQVKQQGQQLRKQIAETVTTALSRRAVGDTRRQLNTLRSELKKRRGSGGNGGVSSTAMLVDIMPVFAGTTGVTTSNISFTGKNGELRLNCWAPSFDALQGIQTQLNKQGFDVKFTASADGDGQQGTFRIQSRSNSQQAGR